MNNRIRAGARWRRVIDVAAASVGLVVFSIPMLLIGFAVSATSRGGMVFAQQRVGRDGDMITVLKFRSMVRDAHDLLHADEELRVQYVSNGFKLAGDRDPRITRIGRLLRKSSLDELPQLWNVLRGQMSIVGIRPLLSDELALRPERDQELYRLLRPGMTGLWQVRGRSTVDPVNRVALDREYVETWSLWNDIKIIVATPVAVLRVHHTH